MRVIALLVVLSFLTATGPAAAQQQRLPVPAADAWRALASAIEPGAFVSVRTKDGTRVRGTLVQRTDDGILVKPKTRLASPMTAIAYADIDGIERWKPGMSAGLKVVLGVGIGAGVMLLAGAIIVAAASY